MAPPLLIGRTNDIPAAARNAKPPPASLRHLLVITGCVAQTFLSCASTFVGPIVGGLVLGALPEVLRFLAQYRGVFNGLVLLLVIVYLPGGLVNPAGWRSAWRRLRGEKRTPA